MHAVADASSLIVLARQNALWLLGRAFDSVLLVPEVHVETVVQGKAKGYPDAKRIEAVIISRQLTVISSTAAEKQLALSLSQSALTLSWADYMTLVCAKERSLMLLMEEQRGRHIAIAHGIAYMTIHVLPLHTFILERISFSECDDLLMRIGSAMHTDQAVLRILRDAANEIRRLRSV